MTPERAEELVDLAKAGWSGCYYDWVAHLEDYMTHAEKEEVKAKWKTMSGNSCWWDAFNAIRKGI